MKVNMIISVVGIVVLIGGMILMMEEGFPLPLNILGVFITWVGFCIMQFFPENPRWFSALQCIGAFTFVVGLFLGTRVFTGDHATFFCVIGGAVFPIVIAYWGQSKGFKTKRRLFDNQ